MLSKSKSQTQKIAKCLAKKIISESAGKHAKVLALIGDLGSGKTAFVQGFIKSLGIKTHVPSPTFVIYRKYPISCKLKVVSCKFKNIYHFDLYRIEKPKEIINLDFSAGGAVPTVRQGPSPAKRGWKKFIANPENIVLIEWPKAIMKYLPKDTICIEFNHGKFTNERFIKIAKN